MIKCVLAAAIVAAFSSAAFAQGGPSETFDIKTVDPESFRAIAFKITDAQKPDIDGKLTDEVWALAPAQGNFIQREPSYGAPATERTEFRILYDDKTLYFGVWVWDSDAAGIMGSEMKRDAGLNKGDQLKITIDTFHDHRNAFYFSTNPLGAYKDANTVENGRTINYDWNAVWNNKTSRDDKGWYIEIAIPLSQLRFKTTIGESTWGLNLCRILFRRNEESYWVPFPREWGASGFARVSNAGVLQGLNNIKSRRRIEFVPFVLPSTSRDYSAPSAPGMPSAFDAKYGGDFKIGLTNDLIADFTYHTDFAQVEADQEVVNLTRFSLFFPEKRQFFTETAGIFDFAKLVGGNPAPNDPGLLNIFYSRRIGLVDGQQVPIVGGGRLTGRVGPYAIGVMNISTEEEALANREVGNANFTVVRLKRNVLKSSNVGALIVNSQDGISDYNRAIGLDGGWSLGRHITMTTALAKTFSPRSLLPDAGSRSMAGVVDYTWKNDRFVYGAQYLDVGEQFNPEMGFVPRLDVRAGNVRAAWTPRPTFGRIRQMVLAASSNYYENHAGVVDSKQQAASVQMERQNTSSAFAAVTHEFDNLQFPFATAGTTLPVGAYAWTYTTLQYSSNRTYRIFGTVSGDLGGYYNGHRQSIKTNINVNIGKTMLIEPNYTHNRVTLPGRPVYNSNVMNLRMSHSFSPDFYLKGFFQYNDDRKSSSFNFLWWYHYKPGSDLYVVYNQGWDIDLPLTSREAIERSYRVRSKSLAVKLTYWLAR